MPAIALFVVDIQHELAGDPSTEIPAAERIREVATAILKKARNIIDEAIVSGRPSPMTIIFVQHEESPDEGTLTRGSKPWELSFPPSESSSYERLVAKTTRMIPQDKPALKKWH